MVDFGDGVVDILARLAPRINEEDVRTLMPPFISFAQNGEDVVLHRALAGVERGVYIEVGANHPTDDSVSRSFYDRGWRGIAIEPNPAFAALYRSERPGDTVVEAAVTDASGAEITLHMIDGTGLSTIVDSVGSQHAQQGRAVHDVTVPTARLDAIVANSSFAASPIHFLMIDTEGAELDVLRSIDLSVVRPWILVIEATAPGSTRPTSSAWESIVIEAGYRFCLFDGLSRFYIADEKYSDLGDLLSYPACVFDDYVTAEEWETRSQLEHTIEELVDARNSLVDARNSISELTLNLDHVRGTLSWRATAPLRSLRSRLGRR